MEGLFETMWTTKAGILLLENDKTRLRLAYGIGLGLDEQVLYTDPTLLAYVLEHPEPIDVVKASSIRLGITRAGVLDELR